MNPLFIFTVSFLASFLVMPLLKRVAFRFNILDFPGGRKVHTGAIPLLGGLGIYLGLSSGLIFALGLRPVFLPLFIGATAILALGIASDILKLTAGRRLLLQSLISLAMIFMGVRVSFLPTGFWGDLGEIMVTLIWLVGVTNAYNYLDGLDGLAAGSAIINFACYAFILFSTGQYALGALGLILIAACLGFLPYNFKEKKIFLGEGGSTFLGFTLAGIALIGNWAEDNTVRLFIPILILGVPIFDMIFTTIMRIKEKKVKTFLEWLRYGGRDHFHHYLVDLGFHSKGATSFIYFITLSLGISAIMVSNDLAVEAYLTLTQAAIIFGIIATLIVVGKRFRSG